MAISRRSLLTGLGAGITQAALDRGPFPASLARAWALADLTLRIADVRIEIAPGHVVTTRAYNGDVTGAPIRLREGERTTVALVNDGAVEEYVHWHGFLIPAQLDGTPEERSLAIAPGGRLHYTFTAEPSGSRFVHSHAMAMDDLSAGVYSGQFAPVFVVPKSDPGSYDQEIFLTTHEWEPYFTTDDEEEFALEGALRQITNERKLQEMAQFATREVGYKIASINGRALGYGEPVFVKRGHRVLLRMINASATQNIRLALPNHRFLVTALDGNAVPSPQLVDVLEIGVAERVDAVVSMDHPGVWVLGSTDPVMRDKGLGIVVEYANESGSPRWIEPPESIWDYSRFGLPSRSQEPAEEIPMTIARLPPEEDGTERWAINGKSYAPEEPPTVLHQGHRYRFVFRNRTDEAHPLHLHRSKFELTQVNGSPTAGVKKDVVVVKGFQSAAIDLTPTQTGLMLFHCHQQLHMDGGFKKLFKVV